MIIQHMLGEIARKEKWVEQAIRQELERKKKETAESNGQTSNKD